MPLVVFALLHAAPAVQTLRLEWQAPQECQKDAFVTALRFRTSRAEIVEDSVRTDELISIHVARSGKRLRGTLRVQLPTGLTRREARSPNCSSVLDALSLMLALVIDPEHARLGPLPKQLPPPPAPEPPKPEVVTPVGTEAVSKGSLEKARVEPAALEATTLHTAPAVEAAQAEPGLRVWLGASGHLTTAISGATDPGASLHLGLERGLLLARVEVGGGAGRLVNSQNGDARYNFHLLAGIALGLQRAFGIVRLEGSAVVQALFFQVRSPSAVRPVEAVRFSTAAGPQVGLFVEAGRWVVGARCLLGINLRRDTYFVDPEGSVFGNPLLFVQPALVGALAW